MAQIKNTLSRKKKTQAYLIKFWGISEWQEKCKVITSVFITVGGLLCYLIPGVGVVVGSTLTSAGLSGLIKAVSDPDCSWTDFAKETGI